MTHIPVQLPFGGFTEQSQFSAVPQGMTPSCLNVMPTDIWNGRMRISTRNGTQLYNDGSVQFMGTYRIYEGGVLVERIIFVRLGKVYYANPRDDLTATATLFGDGTTQSTAFLSTTGLVEGVQFNDHFYFVDGDHYVLVHLHAPTDADAVHVWGDDSPVNGPFHTDPSGYTPGDGTRATLICRWGARLVLAGYKETPHIWYACAPDDPYINNLAGHGSATPDGWDASVYIGAISGTSANEYGTLPDPIVAIFPFAQSGLMFACTNSFSFLTGDPAFDTADVQIVNLTKSIGIAGRRAWCQSQEKGAFILANDGLYFIQANDFNFNRANRVSAGKLDSFFLRLDFGTPAIGGSSPLSGGTLRSLQTDFGSASGAEAKTQTDDGGLTEAATARKLSVPPLVSSLVADELATGEVFPCLCYDPDREGVWMFLTVNDVEQSSLHLFYDLKTNSFWPQRFSDPNIYGPTSAVYVGTSRSESGRLFMGGSQSICIIDRAFPIGIDGYSSEITDEDQVAQFVRSSLTFGPIIGQLPYRVMMNEVRIDLADDDYELPSGFNDLSQQPILSVTTGDTAQLALGLQTDALFVVNLNPIVIDGGSSSIDPTTPNYDGGGWDPSGHAERIDGRFAARPFGRYTQDDPFASGISRTYDGPGEWTIRWDTSGTPRWTIAKFNGATWDIEYEQIVPDIGSPNGSMVTVQQDPIDPPDPKDNAEVSGASFPDSEVTEIGQLVSGRNNAKKCRIRSEAMYLTVASDGRPWSVERMSVIVSQVGKSRGDP
jgi:hypothetical protein